MTYQLGELARYRRANQGKFLGLYFQARKQFSGLKMKNGYSIHIDGTNFCVQWLGTPGDIDSFELLTNYTKDKSWQSLRNSFSGSLADCIEKANSLTSYFARQKA